jgi:hypothetical protein
MNARIFLAAAFGLTIHVFGQAARAAPVAYDFTGYVVRSIVADPTVRLPLHTPIYGTLVVDLALPPDRQLLGFTVLGLSGLPVESLPGHPDNRISSQTTFDLNSGVPPPHWEIVTASASTGPLPEQGGASLGMLLEWNGEPGASRQYPPGAEDVDLSALTPRQSWRIRVTLADASVTYATASGNIQVLRRRGSGAPDYEERFSHGLPQEWAPLGGTWSAATGDLRNQSNTEFTSSTIDGLSLPERYVLVSDVYLSWGASGNTAGLLFNYHGPRDFYEVRMNARGAVWLNEVRDGVRSNFCTGTYPHAGVGRWSHVSVSTELFALRVEINGARVCDLEFNLEDPFFILGSVGVFSSWNLARFDNLMIGTPPFRFQTSLEFARFDTPGALDGFAPQSGTWTAANTYLRSSANQAASIAVYQPQAFDGTYGISARISLEWSGPGNWGGFVYDYVDSKNYRELRLSRSVPGREGMLILAEVVDGRRREVFRAPRFQGSTVSRDVFVTLSRDNGVTIVNDLNAFINVQVRQTPLSVPVRVGLFASWNLVRFDDVAVYTAREP